MTWNEGHSPELDAKFDRVVIGPRQPGPITLVDYDHEWPGRFEAVRGELTEALGEYAMRIEHIGSTAVPGLAAKPIIDVLVTVAEIEPEEPYATPLVALGYALRVREPSHRMFRPRARDVHLHFWPERSAEASDYLLLRDRLRANAADREEYARLKRDLARLDWPDLNYYARAKGPLIREILERARALKAPPSDESQRWARSQSVNHTRGGSDVCP